MLIKSHLIGILIFSIFQSVFATDTAVKSGQEQTPQPVPSPIPAPVNTPTASKTSTVLSNLVSPLATDARYIFLSGILATVYTDSDSFQYNERIRTKVRYGQPLKRYGYAGEVIGWGYLNAAYGIYYLIKGISNDDNLSKERAEIMGTASVNTLIVTALMKTLIHSRRPGYPEQDDSFPSGHASMSFAFATVVMAEHGPAYGIPALTLASFIGYSRIHDDWHWFEDVVAGASLGASYGLGVWLNHRRNNLPFILSIAPLVRDKGMALAFGKSF